jgi:hypothetical protein
MALATFIDGHFEEGKNRLSRLEQADEGNLDELDRPLLLNREPHDYALTLPDGTRDLGWHEK